MRSPITISMVLCFLASSAQEADPGHQVASVLPKEVGKARPARWSGSGRTFNVGQPIEPMPLRAITWEFGDGSLSHILPPRPWLAVDEKEEPALVMAPLRERNGGSPCVGSVYQTPEDAGATEPRPSVVSEGGVPVLITTGLGVRYLAVRSMDPVRGACAGFERGFASGRWAFSGAGNSELPVFITVQDLITGERWYAGADL